MQKFLLFQLYGPMASWGDVAVGEHRPTANHPSKSAISGLLAAARGVRRDEENIHRDMVAGYGFGVRVDAPGELLRDYHTVQVPPAKGKVRFFTRRDELRNAELNTILSSRDYRMDACYAIAVWVKEPVAPFSLEVLKEALQRPRLALYLGRKACPLGMPMQPQLVEAASLKSAFEAFHCLSEGSLLHILSVAQTSYYWEELSEENAGMAASMVYPRRDHSLNRVRWQFTERNEFYFSESVQEGQG